ncbi:TetR/AcrR family transcriptional regulator [Salimicrobium halophilum]|uniref:DNA-binding transcriptional regulator, AcrR family n=1 Tax=Salimicrobium halophilum TaxID=86666 RepID=A0A1G8UXD3_9BACI|nr:TetR/AcrR family transcriptional regulator [Salimicrobium halophilum]SDJ58294.1 DNA-binding transcriptional regulator, AcrR family [Salimicrobium halophilum]
MTNRYPDRRVQRTKENMQEALVALLEEKELSAIYITEITELAKYNRGTFYTHYDTKEDLLDETIDDLLVEMEESFRSPYEQDEIIDLYAFDPSSLTLFDHFKEKERFYKTLLHKNTNWRFREKMTDRLEKMFFREFDFSIDEDPSIDLSLFRTYRIHGIIGLILNWIEQDFEPSADYMKEQLIYILRFHTPTIRVRRD